ncbi:carbohydrate ABC transporter permease [Georgenia deserti]|uniref:Carbohydrate ABC transporter permease n=1 Tax=Georgenia deserti TaxID=2093781 RepID=A0ABW4L2Q7_9MICO
MSTTALTHAPTARSSTEATTPRRRRIANRRRFARHVLLTIVLVPAAALWLYPVLWMVSASLKTNTTIFSSMGLIPEAPEWENYTRAWWTANIGPYFWNTLLITAATIAIVVITTAMIGYVLGTFPFPGRRIVMVLMIATLFLPEGYTIIPIFDLIRSLGLSTSLAGIVLAESGGAHVMIILLFAGYFRQLPRELIEASRIDGAGFLRTFWTVMLPLAKPVLATAIIMTLMRVWNSFLIPLVLTLTRPDQRTLAVGVYAFQGENATDWTGMAAASTISMLPIIIAFLLLQRYFVEGIAGAIRG